MVGQALKRFEDDRINDVSVDGDNKDGEIILTTDDDQGNQQAWVIRSRDIEETDPIMV